MEQHNNLPNASRLMESLRHAGYDNYSAICDLIDNSLDAQANEVRISIGKSQDDYLLTIADNGFGMDLTTLREAIRLGSDTDRNEQSDLGKFGMGLVTASISIGRRLMVITKSDGKTLTAVHDLDEIKRANAFVSTVREANDLERKEFRKRLGMAESGTVLYVSKIDRLGNANLTSFNRTLITRAGRIFREFLKAGKSILIDDKEVKPEDPLMLDHPDTLEMCDETRQFDGKTVRLRIAQLPYMTPSDAKDKGLSIRNQGFYLMRNNREIAAGEDLNDLFTKHGYLNRFRAELFFDGGFDGEVGINFTKKGVVLADNIRSWVNQLAGPSIQTIRKHAAVKGSGEEQETVVDHGSAQRAIKAKANLLSRPKLSVGPKDKWRGEHSNIVEFAEKKQGILGAFVDIESYGPKLKVTYNTEHPFYRKIFSEAGGNKDLTDAIDFLTYAYSNALQEITYKEGDVPVQYIFLNSVANNLRTLLD